MTRVIAYAMHEEEHLAAGQYMTVEQRNAAYIVGTTDDDGIEALRAAGLIVEEIDVDREVESSRRRSAVTTAATPLDGPRPVLAPLGSDDVGTFVVTFDGPLDEARDASVEALGVAFVERLSSFSWALRATPRQAAALTGLPFVIDVTRPGGVAWTDTEGAGEGVLTDLVGQPVLFDLVLDGSVAMDDIAVELTTRGAQVVYRSASRIRVRVPADHPLLADPGGLAGVAFGWAGTEATLHLDYVRPEVLGRAAAASIVGAPAGLTGEGELVAVLDTGIDGAHPDLAGRIGSSFSTFSAPDASDRHGHGTHVAGIVAGDGSSSGGRYRGVAPTATLIVQSSADASGTLVELPVSIGARMKEAYDAGARIMNNSWGDRELQGEYTVDSWEVDRFVWEHKDFVVVFSAGNDATDRGHEFVAGTGFSVTAPGTARNVITVGAARSGRRTGGWAQDTWGSRYSYSVTKEPIASEPISGDSERLAPFSGRGPSLRVIKPDLVAPGTSVCSTGASAAQVDHFCGAPAEAGYLFASGTSMAAPVVAGAAALVRQWYRLQGVDPSAALIKATLVNGTRWLTGSDADGGQGLPPNNEQGFGMVDLGSTLPHDAADDFDLRWADTWTTPARKFTRDGTATTWEVEVRADSQPLRACLTFTDAPGRGVQNDLNLYAEAPGETAKVLSNPRAPGRIWHELDKDNSVEVIRVEHPALGVWRFRIVCGALARGYQPQDYALVVSGAFGGPRAEPLTFHGW